MALMRPTDSLTLLSRHHSLSNGSRSLSASRRRRASSASSSALAREIAAYVSKNGRQHRKIIAIVTAMSLISKYRFDEQRQQEADRSVGNQRKCLVHVKSVLSPDAGVHESHAKEALWVPR